MAGKVSQIKAPDHTHHEAHYLARLIANKVPVCVKLEGDEEVSGVIEFYDARFIRLTRDGEPNLFVYKQDIKYLYERT